MPTANEKDAYYFPHDSNARNGPKILALRSVHHAEGYGIYFMLIEILREQPHYKLSVTKYLFDALALQMQCPKETVQKVIENCCNEFVDGGKSLLTNDSEFLYSESLIRRMEAFETAKSKRKEKAAKAAATRWEGQSEQSPKCASNAQAKQMQCQTMPSKVKESK